MKAKIERNVPLDALIKNMEDVMRSGYTDVKGAAFMTRSEYALSEQKTIEVYRAYLKKHPEMRGR